MTGGPSDFFGSEILDKSDFGGSIKGARILFFGGGGRLKTEGFFGVGKKVVRFFSSEVCYFFGYEIQTSVGPLRPPPPPPVVKICEEPPGNRI